VNVVTAAPLSPDDWTTSAACRGRLSLFYADDAVSKAVAVAICAGCRVRLDCEAETRRIERPWLRFGIRAGATPEQRRAWD
jgi:hypothetical protein